ncbi:hypothetical protein CWE09_06885 [Aliidiomarina minuta]|uniref:Type II secretion system protein N n=1 Tax=Aliidiomarina minuta TaxID=880057 RepID=A0A432W8W8_9GAMM|nr:type II secretion system protein N [Aliidiomarina minuta]RUO26426.1 hypothetical protein CWE09_06885 [Aliidiomarina minuta]
MNKWGIIGLLVFIYLVALVVLLPARFVLQFVQPPAEVEWGAVSGSIWSGQIGTLRVQDITLREIDWRLSPLALVVGRAQVSLHIGDHPDNIITGQGELRMSSSTLAVEALNLHGRVADLATLSPVPSPFALQGEFSLNLTHYQWGQPLCSELNGQVQVNNAALQIGRNWEELGDFNADLNCENGRIIALLDDANRLGLTADAEIWAQGARAEFSINPPPEAPRAIRNLMDVLPPEARQTQRLNFTF